MFQNSGEDRAPRLSYGEFLRVAHERPRTDIGSEAKGKVLLSDGEFVVRHVRAESDDGRTQTVRVKVDAGAVKFEEGPVGGRAPAEVREAIETRGKSVIEHRRNRMDLPPSFLYRRGFGGFIEE